MRLAAAALIAAVGAEEPAGNRTFAEPTDCSSLRACRDLLQRLAGLSCRLFTSTHSNHFRFI